MSISVKRALPMLKVLAEAKPELKKAIIRHVPAETIQAISEIVLNMLKGVIKLTARQRQRLSRYKKVFRSLADKALSIPRKRKLLVQKGGGAGLAALIPIALAVLANS